MNEVPEPTLEYSQQSVFKPIKPGEGITVNAEAYYMKGKDYTWTVQTRSKEHAGESKFAVRIE